MDGCLIISFAQAELKQVFKSLEVELSPVQSVKT